MPSAEARTERSKLVQAVADEFVDLYVSAAGLQAHVTIYMHVIKVHLSQFVQLYANLMDYSAQGSEHCHVLTKYAFKHQTNKRVDERVEQAMTAVALQRHYEQQYPSTVGTGTKRKSAQALNSADEARQELIQEILEMAELAARAAFKEPVQVEEVEEEDEEQEEGEGDCPCPDDDAEDVFIF